ncbi:MAG: tyrosine-type recombinase/integrase [Clostridia bacterium]|nr:tyrosine-type recombinase/integrase [Clostridia bacterium]
MNTEEFKNHLIYEEKSEATVASYVRDVTAYMAWLNGREISKELNIMYKAELEGKYEASSVNTMLSSLNSYFEYIGHSEYKVKNLRVQQNVFINPNKELTKAEYERLLRTAYNMGKHRIYCVMQTIGSCGIRVSELQYITVEAVNSGIANVTGKCKSRTVYLPEKLISLLKEYIKMKGIEKGSVFVTRTGRPLDRSNIWTEMKKLCIRAGVLASKVFPHSLRHLFARTYYKLHQDVVRLADILGHSSVNTTRIYTAESGRIHYERIQLLDLVFDFKCRITT